MKRFDLAWCAMFAVVIASSVAGAFDYPVLKVNVPMRLGPPQESGPTSLAMVLAAYGADSTTLKRTREAFDRATQSTSIEALHATAVKLGYPARIATPGLDSLAILVGQGIAPIVYVEPRPGTPAKPYFFVIVTADTRARRYLTRDGRAKPLMLYARVLGDVWSAAHGRVLIVSPRKNH